MVRLVHLFIRFSGARDRGTIKNHSQHAPKMRPPFSVDGHRQSSKSLGALAREILTPMFKAHDHLRLMMDWSLIVGEDLAKLTWPQKTVTTPRGQILYVRVAQEKSMEVWGASPLIIERVNQYLGWGAVHRVRILYHRCG